MFRIVLRQLIHTPGYSLTVVLTLALAIGANSAVFSAVNAVLHAAAAGRRTRTRRCRLADRCKFSTGPGGDSS